jgi:hypothetical protein
MREAVNIHALPAPLLNTIVANRGGRRQSLVNIAFLEPAARLCRVRPDAGVTIRLKL